MDLKLEVVIIPVSDVDRAKQFYGTTLGCREDADAGGGGWRVEPTDRGVEGPDTEGRSYGSYASFSDPDGNAWLLQEITERLPGRV